MSRIQQPPPGKLFVSIISTTAARIAATIDRLCRLYGPVDFVSPLLPFDYTSYYAEEMGPRLVRRFASFAKLLSQELLVEVKEATNELEARWSVEGKRTVNIDPGLLTLERLVLATGKNYTHRVYLRRGIFADLTLVYRRGGYQPLEWTYPDYREPNLRRWLGALRQSYLYQLRQGQRFCGGRGDNDQCLEA